MNLKITYRFKELSDVADFFDQRAEQERSLCKGSDNRRFSIHTERADVWEIAASVIRNTILGEDNE